MTRGRSVECRCIEDVLSVLSHRWEGKRMIQQLELLKGLVESGYGLNDSTVELEQAPLSQEVNYVYNS